MKRREYLSAVTAGTAAGTAGCFWEDGDSEARLGIVTISNYYNRPQRFVVHVEENGEDATTTELELEGGGNYPTAREIDCEWSTEPGEFTVQILQHTEPTDSVELSIPGERTNDRGVSGCVGVDFLAGFREFEHVEPRVANCADYSDDVEFCVNVD